MLQGRGLGRKVKDNHDKGKDLGTLPPDPWLGAKDHAMVRSAEDNSKWNNLVMLDREGKAASAT